MPIKWTPETDQILLLKILETSDISPKCAEIVEKWPADLERPTARAISERIFKIRAMAKASGAAGHFSVPSANSKGGTPSKKAAGGVTKKATPKKPNGTKAGAGKRKRGGQMSDEEIDDDSEADVFKSDDNGSDIGDNEVPKKKAKVNGAAKGKGKGKVQKPVKVELSEIEESTFHDDHCEEYYGGDGATESLEYA